MYLANINVENSTRISLFRVTSAGAVSEHITRRKTRRYLSTPGILQATSTEIKNSKILKKATARPVLKIIPINTGPSRFPEKETRLLRSACSSRYFTASQYVGESAPNRT